MTHTGRCHPNYAFPQCANAAFAHAGLPTPDCQRFPQVSHWSPRTADPSCSKLLGRMITHSGRCHPNRVASQHMPSHYVQMQQMPMLDCQRRNANATMPRPQLQDTPGNVELVQYGYHLRRVRAQLLAVAQHRCHQRAGVRLRPHLVGPFRAHQSRVLAHPGHDLVHGAAGVPWDYWHRGLLAFGHTCTCIWVGWGVLRVLPFQHHVLRPSLLFPWQLSECFPHR